MTLQEAYVVGLCDGIRAYAWMKDGTYYVGTTGRTLAQALEDAQTGEYPPQADTSKQPPR
jgi:predicted transcriptional regulator